MLYNQIHIALSAVIHVSATESQPKGGFGVTTEPRWEPRPRAHPQQFACNVCAVCSAQSGQHAEQCGR